MELRRSSKFERSLGSSVISKSFANELAWLKLNASTKVFLGTGLRNKLVVHGMIERLHVRRERHAPLSLYETLHFKSLSVARKQGDQMRL
jgi:hypothetical protein